MRMLRGFGVGLSVLSVVAAMLLVAALTVSAGVGATVRVSVNGAGEEGDAGSNSASVSADGRYVAFASGATNLVDDDTNDDLDVFVRDLEKGTNTLVSRDINGSSGDGASVDPSISADGRYVAFYSSAPNLVAGDTNGWTDVFVHDRQKGTTTLVSKSSDGTLGNSISGVPSISPDGNHVAFVSYANNLVDEDTNNVGSVFVHDWVEGTTTLVSKHTTGTPGAGASWAPSISADGRYVAFHSDATNLIDEDTNGYSDVFVHDRDEGTTALISAHPDGTLGNERSFAASITADGHHVAFESFATNLVDGDTTSLGDVFVHDLEDGTTSLVSTHSDGTQGNGGSGLPSISADGSYVAFYSWATNLVDGGTTGHWEVFVHDRTEGTTALVSTHSDGTQGNERSFGPSISADGRYVSFESDATNLVDDDTNDVADVFIHQYLEDPPPPTTSTTSAPTTTVPATTTVPTTTTAPSTTVPPTTLPEVPEDDPDFFTDDDGHIFEDDINAIAEEGITVGCNPPENTHFCPDESFLRGQAAAFVRRALNVPASDTDHFTDDANSVFEGDIDAIAKEAITVGCNPPENTMFCPTDPFTRGQAAAFVRRALNVPTTSNDHFTDDDGHLFENDINAIAEAGITIGCNPSDNNHYCPNDSLTRGQAAAFMRRALLD